ncbi:hypothetical protein [uncultured Draconibacterium sp.]|uniref:hypothetical protein n=1 Tax=uncultured Draconibacterium sp. TaxID=1573823 RepID=UPI0032608BD6
MLLLITIVKLVNWYIYERTVSPYVDKNGLTRAVDYRLQKEYYWYSSQEGLQKIKLNRRALFLGFPENKKEIRKILRQRQLLVQNEQSMVLALSLLKENGIIE